MYARPTALVALTGERNESSVLFSLATLARQAPAPEAPKVTESSALIDIRALSGGGAFAPLFASPLAPPVTFAPADAEKEDAPGRGKGSIMIGAIVLGVVAMASVAAFVKIRSPSRAPAITASTAETPVAAPAEVPSVATMAKAVAPEAAMSAAAPARSTARSNNARPVVALIPTVSTVSTSSTSSASSASSASSTARAAPKCCPGESEMACQMRVAAGAACGAEPARPTGTSAPPFDRPAAARALAVNVASCKRGDGPTGAGHVKVTFQPSGTAIAVDMDAPYAGTATGTCVAQRYRGASVPAFAGGPISVGKTFAIE